MKSINFEFLRGRWGTLADLAGFAESYVHTDVPSALVKLRTFAEQMVNSIYAANNIRSPYNSSFIDKLQTPDFTSLVPKVIINSLDLLRKRGNKGAHGNTTGIRAYEVIELIGNTYHLATWFHIQYNGGQLSAILPFDKEVLSRPTEALNSRELRILREKLLVQEETVNLAREQLEEANRKLSETDSRSELIKSEVYSSSTATATLLEFNEEETRKRLIDEMLVEAGWDLSNTEIVKQEEPKLKLRNGKNGIPDYVLFASNGLPIGVIEAKKTYYDAIKGKQQGIKYADALEDKYGQRPIIFYTNGYDITILDDAKAEVGRKIHGYYSPDNLSYLHSQTKNRSKLVDMVSSEKIAGRLYQVETIKRVCETFENFKKRRALVIQATGTGKTRVAIALTDLMFRAKYAKRILFLCDRKELRKQANNAYMEFLGDVPRVVVSKKTRDDRTSRIYLATYPGMMKTFKSLDVGFFDLIIADESHRSIYNRYHELFMYFDAYQVGLTATPITFINRNTYSLFGCDDQNPTAYYSYEDAINHNPPFLSKFTVTKHTTKFLRDGIKYSALTQAQKEQLEEQVEDSENVDYTKEKISKQVFSKDTDRKILRNLMDNGLRQADQSTLGKTIIFARNHKHAVLLYDLFYEMYPQFGGTFCEVIDNYSEDADALIDQFKDNTGASNLTIAISVDMLDTGIDVPEIINLVLAKPVKSYAKFWQMIGRGTRLCENLFGPGKDKKEFYIFDHWGNFEYFEEGVEEIEANPQKALLTKLFETRLELMQSAFIKQNLPAYEESVKLVHRDITLLPDSTIMVKEHWRDKHMLLQDGIIKSFSKPTKDCLTNTMAPLMQWRSLDGNEAAYRFDLLMTRLQKTVIDNSDDLQSLIDELVAEVSLLPINLSQVAEKIEFVDLVKGRNIELIENRKFPTLEKIRLNLRGIMKFKKKIPPPPSLTTVLDIEDTGETFEVHETTLVGLNMHEYQSHVQEIFDSVFEDALVLQKIRRGEPVTDKEIQDLVARVQFEDPAFSIEDLISKLPKTENNVYKAILQIVGMDIELINQHFEEFVQSNPTLNAHQIRFLSQLKNHVSKHGSVEISELYEPPFTHINAQGLDGVFPVERMADELVGILEKISTIPDAYKIVPTKQNQLTYNS